MIRQISELFPTVYKGQAVVEQMKVTGMLEKLLFKPLENGTKKPAASGPGMEWDTVQDMDAIAIVPGDFLVLDFDNQEEFVIACNIIVDKDYACIPSERGTVAFRYLVQFVTMPADTLGGVYAQMVLPLRIFSGDMNVRYAFRENPLKLNPKMLINGKNVFLRIKEENIANYACILKLLLNQQIHELEEKQSSNKIYMIVDELARILSGSSSGGGGRLERLLDGSRTMRSRGVCMLLITQSCEGLMCSYTETEVMDLISNCSYIAVLNATSAKTQDMIVSWCGKYNAKKKTWDGSGANRKSTISFEEKDRVSAEELMTLPTSGEGELLLISPYGYNRIKKVSYYNDKYITPLAKKIREENELINKVMMKG